MISNYYIKLLNYYLRVITSIFILFSIFCSMQMAEDEIKELQKADKIREKADKLNTESLDLYLKVNDMRLEGEDKKANKTESEAQQKEEQALSLYKQANEITYNYYLSAIEKQIKEDNSKIACGLIKDQAEDIMYKAGSLRTQAGNEQDITQKLNYLNQAYNQELMAIEEIIKAYESCGSDEGFSYQSDQNQLAVSHGYNQPSYTTDESSGEIILNYAMIEKIKNYMGKSAQNVVMPKDFTAESIDEFIRSYRENTYFTEYTEETADTVTPPTPPETYDLAEAIQTESQVTTQVQSEPIETEIEQTNQNNTTNEPLLYIIEIPIDISKAPQKVLSKIYNSGKKIATKTEDGIEKLIVVDFASYDEALDFKTGLGSISAFIKPKTTLYTDFYSHSDSKTTSPINSENGKTETEKPTSLPQKQSTTVQPQKHIDLPGITYVIQIKANKSPLSRGELKSMYQGDYDINTRIEDGLHKYQIGSTHSYIDAKRVLETVDYIEDAFIVAYENGQKINVADAIKRTEEYDSGVHYYVQLAADIAPLSNEAIREKYTGNHYIRIVEEGNWFKYQVEVGNSYEQAKEVARNASASGAFVVAYKDGKRINLWEAINEVKTQSEGIRYYIQIAASRTPLNNVQVLRIYDGDQKVRKISEDGWYKYQIEAGKNYSDAKQLRSVVEVRGAFIVAYSNGKKMELYKAINATQ